MKKEILEVQRHYDVNPQKEWDRLKIRHPYEKYITTRMMDRYVKPHHKILDIGGGPGHYAIYFSLKGNDVTLVDLSNENVKYAKKKAHQYKTKISACQGNALDLSAFADNTFDIVFLMGPLYHLLDEEDRLNALKEAKRVLKTGGYLFASFILMFGGVIFCLRDLRGAILDSGERRYFDTVLRNESLSFEGFTHSYMCTVKDAKGLLDKVKGFRTETIFSQEGNLAPYLHLLANTPFKQRMAWYEFGYQICDNENYLTHGEHLLIISSKL